jgi:hypothetical protein
MTEIWISPSVDRTSPNNVADEREALELSERPDQLRRRWHGVSSSRVPRQCSAGIKTIASPMALNSACASIPAASLPVLSRR